jgi:hypothetical protein
MKELFSAFSAAVFYPLVSLAMPGLAAISGWFVLLATKPDSVLWLIEIILRPPSG